MSAAASKPAGGAVVRRFINGPSRDGLLGAQHARRRYRGFRAAIGRYPSSRRRPSARAFYTGANAQRSSAVTTPPNRHHGVEGISTDLVLYDNGFSSITVTFEVARDPDLAEFDVQTDQLRARRMPRVRTTASTSQGSGIPAASASI